MMVVFSAPGHVGLQRCPDLPRDRSDLLDFHFWPKLARFVDPALRTALLTQLSGLEISYSSVGRMTDYRDPKDDMHLVIALASGANRFIGTDADLLVLHAGRGMRIPRPTSYQAGAGHNA